MLSLVLIGKCNFYNSASFLTSQFHTFSYPQTSYKMPCFCPSRYTKRGIINIPSEIGMRGRCWLIKSDGKTELLPEICNSVYRAQDSDRYNMLLAAVYSILNDTLDHNANIFIFIQCFMTLIFVNRHRLHILFVLLTTLKKQVQCGDLCCVRYKRVCDSRWSWLPRLERKEYVLRHKTR